MKFSATSSQRLFALCLLALLALAGTACGASARPVIPTRRPTATITLTPTASRTPGFATTPTPTPTPQGGSAVPTPTSIFGPTQASVAALPTATRVVNPNAPRIEFFTADQLTVAPGNDVTLFWSVRNTSGAVIYRLEADGQRNQLWNVAPDGNLTVTTRRRDRGAITFVLSVGEGAQNVEQTLSIPLSCPDAWFFQPAPDSCPTGPAETTSIIEEPFERGRMLYIQSRNRVYTLFNDGKQPAWVSVENRYDPTIHPELQENFVPPPGFVQPLRILGFVWRGSDQIRNRLGMGLQAETPYEGFVQTVTSADNSENLYISSSDGSVLQLVPGGAAWQIITAP